jgi:hypothetical protein
MRSANSIFSYEESSCNRASRAMHHKYSTLVIAITLIATWVVAGTCPTLVTDTALRLAALRHVPPPFAPQCQLIQANSLRGELDRKLKSELPMAPEDYVAFLARLGFVAGEPKQIYSHLLDFYASQVLGFFEPETDQLYVVEGSAAKSEMENQMVWAHELSHAAQEKRFRLASRLLALRTSSDGQRAASAIAEGEALLVMLFLSMPTEAGADPLQAAAMLTANPEALLPAPAGVPEYFVQELIYPYSMGLTAVVKAYQAGGWDRVDRLLASPPSSTQQLENSESKASSAAISDGELPATPAGYREILTDTLGQWAIRFWLSTIVPKDQARSLAQGWESDRLRLIERRNQPGQWGLVWRLRCRSEQSCHAMKDAFETGLTPVLSHFNPPGRCELSWASSGRLLELRLAWPPPASPRPTSPS